ncbi:MULTISPECIES: hypothetical protein [Shewanella]|nr:MULTISPECIES: hypothetical protein [Shewanella]
MENQAKVELIEEALLDSVSGGQLDIDLCRISCISCIECLFQD